MQLSEHFTAKELGVEDCELRIRNNAEYLCQEFLEKIRSHFSAPVIIHSGFRDSDHNATVGGKPTSWHLFQADRCACDLRVQNVDCVIVFDWLRLSSKFPFDKIILEYNKKGVPACIHLQAARYSKPRLQAFIGGTGNSTTYDEVPVVNV